MPKPKGKLIAIAAGLLAVAILGIASWLSWPHIKFRWLFEPLGVNAQGYWEYRHRQTGIVMVKLPGGTFWMGAQKTDPKGRNYDPEAEDDEGPVHEVNLSPFLIGKYEVTQAQWKKVMGTNPSHFTGDETRPVESVSWNDIQGFEASTDLTLPIEAEWEYACVGGAATPIAGTGKLDDIGWYQGNSGNETHPVGMKSANGFGLHDLHGNVLEWCENVHITGHRALRGGGWLFPSTSCRTSLRTGLNPGERITCLGFRAAYSAP